MTTSYERVATSVGDAKLWFDEAPNPWLRCVLGHGAGGGPDAVDLEALAAQLPAAGVSVVRVEQPWRVAGRRVAPRPQVLDDGWLAALDHVPREVPVVVGGRSAGARVACRTAAATDAVGVVALAFPLHPPGKPERSRKDELLDAASVVPTLVLQGERDGFGKPGEFPDGGFHLVPIVHADHGMKVTKAHDQRATSDAVVDTVRTWLERTISR